MMRIRWIFLLTLLGLAVGAVGTAGGLERDEMERLCRDGEADFRLATELVRGDPQKAQDLFRRAILSYERIVRDGGVENGKLYYNIANLHFRLGDMGNAVLNYRRAEKYIPHDVNLQQNLQYARSRCLDKIEAGPEAKVYQTLFFWHYDLNLMTRFVLFLVVFNLMWVFAAIRLFRKLTWLQASILVCALLSLLLAGSVAVEAFQESRARSGVIVAKEVQGRKGDSSTFEPTFKEPLHSGVEFTLVEERKGWLHIELADGRRCWVPDSAAGLI